MSDKGSTWPVIAGSYIVADPEAPVAVCTLTSERLMGPLASVPGVAISGMVYTANLGITRIIMNITTNPAIRFLLICGRDSQLFKPGQSLVALSDQGVDTNRRIIGAPGYEPVIQTLAPDQITQFRKQVEVVDWTGEEDLEEIKKRIAALSARNPGRFKTEKGAGSMQMTKESFATMRPGGQREPLIYDPKGYFVINIDSEKEEIVLRHYLPDHKPAHEMRGRGATSMLLGLLREDLVTQLSHAGYLGEELAKAQTALQFNLRYDQDRPLRQRETTATIIEQTSESQESRIPSTQKMPGKPLLQPMTLKQLEDSQPGSKLDFVITVENIPNQRVLKGTVLEMDETEPFTAYHRTQSDIEVRWTPETKFIMGQEEEVRDRAILRVGAERSRDGSFTASSLVVLTRVARIKT